MRIALEGFHDWIDFFPRNVSADLSEARFHESVKLGEVLCARSIEPFDVWHSGDNGKQPVDVGQPSWHRAYVRNWRPLVPRPRQGLISRVSQCLFPIARAPAFGGCQLAQPSRTAVYGPVLTVVWQGSAGDRCPYVDQTGIWKIQVPLRSSRTDPHFRFDRSFR
jgi:hypothetical protein